MEQLTPQFSVAVAFGPGSYGREVYDRGDVLGNDTTAYFHRSWERGRDYGKKLQAIGWIDSGGICRWERQEYIRSARTVIDSVLKDYAWNVREQLNQPNPILGGLCPTSPSSAAASTPAWTWWKRSWRTCRRTLRSSQVALAVWIAPQLKQPEDEDWD